MMREQTMGDRRGPSGPRCIDYDLETDNLEAVPTSVHLCQEGIVVIHDEDGDEVHLDLQQAENLATVLGAWINRMRGRIH